MTLHFYNTPTLSLQEQRERLETRELSEIVSVLL